MVAKTPTDQDRVDAVALCDEFGPDEASARTGWSAKSILAWSRKEVYRTHAPARVDFSEEDWEEQLVRTLKAVALISAERELSLAPQAEMALANKARTTAVHDIRLLEGKVTERTEAIDATEAEARKLAEDIAIRRAQRVLND